MAPANHTYLDQRYAPHVPTDLGQTWACEHGCDVDQFYNWDPAHYVNGVSGHDVIGVEGALWTETLRTRSVAEYMVFPRLLALAEVAWSPRVPRTAHSRAYAQLPDPARRRRPAVAGGRDQLLPDAGGALAPRVGPRLAAPDRDRAAGERGHRRAVRTGPAPAAVHATVRWGDGATSTAKVVGAGPGEGPGQRPVPDQGRPHLSRRGPAGGHGACHVSRNGGDVRPRSASSSNWYRQICLLV